MGIAHQIMLPSVHASPDTTTGSILFIGTATVLIRYAGFTVLTDPNFIHRHEKVDLRYGLSATRQTDPALDIHELPPVDLVLLSHFHGDHFDQVAEREIEKSLPIVTTLEAADALRQRGFVAPYPLTTWEDISVVKDDARLRITATPCRHGPPVVSFALPEVMGSMLEFQPGASDRRLRMYVTGDTLVIDALRELPRRYPDIDLALLHLGGTRVLGILVTMDAEQGVELLQIVKPKRAIPIHYNDYDVFKSPLSEFRQAVEGAGLADRVHYLSHGETYTFTVGE
jgi:L-ascorbate metabolism protein UlaG (beta-lactamase superfamily)